MKFANLHLHSDYSDAAFTPEELVCLGKALGYRALALTDHETDGGCKKFLEAAEAEGIEAITGCEFYGKYDGMYLHLTALDFDPSDPTLRAFIRKRCELYAEGTRLTIERAERLGLLPDGFGWQDVLDAAEDGTWICVDTVRKAMIQKKIYTPSFWKNFRSLAFSPKEARSLKPAPPCAREVIEAVRGAGGVIALAHPTLKWLDCVEALVSFGLNGIEIDHPSMDGESLRRAAELAETFGLYHCGGTDHTGPMSSCGGENAVPAYQGITEEEFYELKNRTKS